MEKKIKTLNSSKNEFLNFFGLVKFAFEVCSKSAQDKEIVLVAPSEDSMNAELLYNLFCDERKMLQILVTFLSHAI